ncbi:hypothetical protein COO60DRAFT_199906 [Scenedesmus sp. NREL 46B-D3]|nr:hypothetical protein COO60DRAFT_199906 [Scenedesmus sp. NREL 46B-D3]
MTVNRRLAKSHGYYLQHAKEVCMVAVKNTSSSTSSSSSRCAARQLTASSSSCCCSSSLWWYNCQQQWNWRICCCSSSRCRGSSSGGSLRVQQGGGLAALAGRGVGSDVIFSERRGQSQKPEEIYHLIEALVPGGRYLEIFARKNNLRNYWVSIGNEVTGTGLPEEDVQAYKQSNCILALSMAGVAAVPVQQLVAAHQLLLQQASDCDVSPTALLLCYGFASVAC